jgi:hypothetical protein
MNTPITPPVWPLGAARLLHAAAVCGMRNPHRAIKHLPTDLNGRFSDLDLSVRAQGLVLLTELFIRTGLPRAAADVIERIAALTAPLPDQAPSLAMMLAGVQADLALISGHDSVIDVCHTYHDLCTAYADLDRAAIAQAMHAIAVFQRHGCGRGKAELTHLAAQVPAGPLHAMLDVTLAEMRSTCTGAAPAVGLTLVPPPLAGLVLHRPTAIPWPLSLAWRVRVQPGLHEHRHTGAPDRPGHPVAPS